MGLTLTIGSEQRSDLVEALRDLSMGAKLRGERYFHDGRVTDVQQREGTFFAHVRGTRRYATAWHWGGRTWGNECTCPLQMDCKHTAALAHYLLQHSAPRKGSGSAGEPVSERKSTRTGGDLATRLARATTPWHRRAAVQYLLAGPPLRLSAYDGRCLRILDEVDHESDPELLCWRLATMLSEFDLPLPRDLNPYLDRPDLRERYGARERRRLADDLLAWASRKAPTQRSLRFVWNLLWFAGRGLQFQVSARLTTSRLEDAPRSFEQLRQLLNDAQRNPGTLPPEQVALLSVCLESPTYIPTVDGFLPSTPHAAAMMWKAVHQDSDALVWGSETPPQIQERGGIRPGDPLRLSGQSVHIVPTAVTHVDGARLELRCVWPGGAQRSLSEILYFPSSPDARLPGYVLADGALTRVVQEPPRDLRDRFLALGGLDIPRDDCANILRPLARFFPNIENALAQRTHFVQGRALFTLDLNDEDWLCLRLFFSEGEEAWQPPQEAAPGQRIFEWKDTSTWLPIGATELAERTEDLRAIMAATDEEEAAPQAPSPHPQVNEEIWSVEPNPASVRAAIDWLDSTRAQGAREVARSLGSAEKGWWLKATAQRMADLAECWDARPRDVQFFGTERVRRLLEGSQSVRPRLKIEASGLDWFSVTPEWEAEGLSLTDADMAKLRSSKARFVKLASGWVRRDAVETHDEAATVLADLGVEIGGGEQRVTLWQLAGAKAESLAALEGMGADRGAMQALRKLRRQLRDFQGVPEVEVPRTVTAELRPYQKRGLDFLFYGARLGVGCILADDMGLGKTLQALAWLQALVDRKPKEGPSLVVCPTSVVHNWIREAREFAPSLRVLALTSGSERHVLRKEIRRYDLVITNYALLRRDIEQWREEPLRAVVLDEAQNIKNPDAVVSRAAGELQARYRLALTGTPLENRPLDLWSIVNFVNPGYLGNRAQFSQRFDRLDAPPHSRALLAAKLRPILLRRLKREVATDLPERIEERRDCELTDGQRQLYLAELRRCRKLVDDLGDDPGSLRRNKITILAALTRLRQICCHPALAKGKADLGSGKFDAVFELLEPLLEEGHKVLLFSQFVRCLELLEKEMERRDIAHHKLTGETVRREAVVRAFQEDPRASVFLVSLKAGGTGLNLTAASYVILFDPWWNPAVEAQAIDRTHRIGQDRTVIAYRMIATGTIEEKIWELQKAKSAMAQDILGEDGFARSLGREDLEYLLREV